MGKNLNPEFIACSAVFHDTSEIITGDMPTPIKYYNSDIKTTYKEIEKTADEKLLSLLPDDLREDFIPLYNPDEESKKIIKAADKISALIKCIEETNMGNREFEAARKSLQQVILDMDLVEANIFMEEFLSSFYLTLDEQL